MATERKHIARAYLVLLALLSSVSDAPSELVDKSASGERGRGISLVDRRETDKDFTATTIRASGDTVFDNNGAAGGPTLEVPQIVINGSITAGDPTQAGRLTTGTISNCAGTNTCPGPVNALARHYDAYTFTNNSAAQACVTVQLNATGCAGQFMASASYLGTFNPSSLCTNFLGVHNSTFNGTQSYSFNVPGDATFIVVVYEATPDTSCASYTLTVSSDDISACPTTVFSANGSITAADPVQAGRNTTGVISNCTTTAACPGPVNTLPRHYDTYTFVNNGPTEECATIELIANACGGTFMAAAAYLNSFNPNNLCANFLGIHNSTFNGTQSFAVRVPAGETIVVVVYEATPDAGCARYTLNVRSCGGLVSTTPRNGRIAFNSDRDGDSEIFVMDANGANQTQLTFNTASDDQPAWSPNGTKIAFTSNRDGNTEIYVMNADGSGQTRLTNTATTESAPAWSPDGRKIAFHTNRDGNFEIYVMDQDGTAPLRLTTNTATDLSPVWSSDGTQIAFSSDRDGNTEIYIMNADGSAQTNLSNDAAPDQLPAFSPLGTKIAFQTLRGGSNEIFLMDRDGTDQINLSNNVATESSPAWSPDGSKILFQSTRDGNQEIYVMNSDGTNQTRLTTNAANDVAADWQPAPLACLPAVIHGNIGQGSPDYPSTSGTQTGRLSQNGVNSSCAAQKPTPGVAGGSFGYDAYQFANESNATACVTFAFPTSCGVNQAIHPVAYLGSYNPGSPTVNYRGDFGSSINVSNSGTFAVNVPAHTTVVLVVHEIGTLPDCPNYSFTVTGLPCPVKIVAIDRPTNGHVRLQGLGTPNASHSVEFSDDLGSSVFQSLDASVIADGLGVLRFEDASATGLPKRFYRFTYP